MFGKARIEARLRLGSGALMFALLELGLLGVLGVSSLGKYLRLYAH